MSILSIAKYIFAILCFIVSLFWLVSYLLKNKKLKASTVLLSAYDIMVYLPEWIAEAEDIYPGHLTGPSKLQYVLMKVEMACIKNNLNFEEYEEDFKMQIEDILSAPHKKED